MSNSKELVIKPIMNPVSISNQTLDVMEIGKLLAQSGYFADVRDMAQAVAKILAGREIGVGPITSLTSVFIVQGRPSYSANIIAAVIKRSGIYNYKILKLDNAECVLEFYEHGKALTPLSVFTLEDACTAELLTGKNAHSWKHYPRNMLFARALTNGQKWHCPDVAGGLPLYTPEELGASVNREGEVIPERPALEDATKATFAVPEEPQQRPPTTGISYPQQKRLFAISKTAGVDTELLKRFMAAVLGVDSTKALLQEEYEGLCKDLESGAVLDWHEQQQDEPGDGQESEEGERAA